MSHSVLWVYQRWHLVSFGVACLEMELPYRSCASSGDRAKIQRAIGERVFESERVQISGPLHCAPLVCHWSDGLDSECGSLKHGIWIASVKCICWVDAIIPRTM